MSKAQETYEAVERLVAEGKTKAEAFRQLAEETGSTPNSVRGAYYAHSRKANGPKARRRVRETTPEGAVESARASLERAISSIDDEIDAAKERAEEAKREFEALKASATERKQAIQAKIEALEA